MPGGDRRITHRRRARGARRTGGTKAGTVATRAGVVVAGCAARVVGVVGRLLDVADQVGAGVNQLEVADFAVDGKRGVLEPVLVVGRAVEGAFPRPELLRSGRIHTVVRTVLV